MFLGGCLITFSQIPSYYNDVNLGLSGQSLKNELATKIISTHTNYISYTPGVWDALKQTDVSPTDPTKVVLIYGWNDNDSDITNDYTRGINNHGGGSGVWNREHVYSKSLGSPNLGTSGVGADAHNLRPADAQRNSSRSNRKFAAGSGNSHITAQGHWYPGDEWKGDVARMMMYMYLHYNNQCLPTGVGVGSTVATDPNMISLFLQWNAEDPVSDLEKQRNPVLEQIQGNRNPFIDNPAFATQIWGGPQAENLFGTGGSTDTQAPSTPSNLTASAVTQTSVNLNWSAASDNVGVSGYQIFRGSIQIATVASTNYTVTGLTAGTSYTFSVKAYDAANNVSNSSNTVSITTTSGNTGGGNGSASEVLISEYVEGASYNKAIEIANFTGSSVNLANYSLKKVSNGGGSWSSTLNLSGTLAHGDVYVVAHSSASTSLKNKANTTSSNSVLSFNGNDAIGLFKNNSLIDVVGNASSSANFGKDQTLQRKSSVNSPNTSYITSEWTVLAKDDYSGVGSHSVDGGTVVDTQAPTAPSSLSAASVTQTSVVLSWNAASDNVGVTAYEVYRGSTKVATVTTTTYTVTNLTAATNYTFSVKAKDEAGNSSSASNTVGITTKSAVSSTTVLTEANFESGWNNWTDGGGDCARYSGSRSYEGNYSIRIRDNSSTASSMTSQSFDLSNYDNVTIDFYFYSYSMETGEDFWVRYYNGSSWQTVESYVSGTDFNNSGFYSATVTLSSNDYNFVNGAKFRFQADASSNADQIYIDQVTIKGFVGAVSSRGVVADKTTLLREFDSGSITTEEDFGLYPNPVNGNHVTVTLFSAKEAKYTIVSLVGKTIKSGSLTQEESTIELGSLARGVYLLQVNDGEETMTKKLVKQ